MAIDYQTRKKFNKVKPAGKKRAPDPDPEARYRYLAGEAVLAAVGRPPDLALVETRTVAPSAVRINLVRGDGGRLTRADSFYVRLHADGSPAYSHPPLSRRYPA